MKKLAGYESHYYSERWEHKGKQICKLTDRSYLLFDDAGEEVEKCFNSLEEAEQYINEHY
jgi:hypothetical protein